MGRKKKVSLAEKTTNKLIEKIDHFASNLFRERLTVVNCSLLKTYD